MDLLINPMNKKCVNIKQNLYFCVVIKNDERQLIRNLLT